MNRDAINWFEIPVLDIDRAQRFYEALLEKSLRRQTMGISQLAVFPYADDGVSGCLQAGMPQTAPQSRTQTETETETQAQGTLVYLDAGPSLRAALDRVASLGGHIATPFTELPPGMGCFAHIIDSEGNRVGLHSYA